jgi:hypothetical protein
MPSWRGAYLIKHRENFPSDGREVPTTNGAEKL